MGVLLWRRSDNPCGHASRSCALYPLGGKYHLPHGVANAILLAPCMAFVRPGRSRNLPGLGLHSRCGNRPEHGRKISCPGDRLQALVHQLKLPNNLADLGVPPEDIASLSEAALNVKRLMNNVPCQLDLQDVQAIYQTLFPQHQFKE